MKSKVIVGGLLTFSANTGRFLLLQRRKDGDFPLFWNIPGGTFEDKDGFPKKTAVREFIEETGHCPQAVSKQPIHHFSDNFVSFYAYVAFVDDEFTPDLKGEHENGLESVNYGWFDYDNIPEHSMPGLVEMIENNKELIETAKRKLYE